MSRLVQICLASMLSFAGGAGFACATDYRLDPDAARRAEIHVSLPEQGAGAAAADKLDLVAQGLPREYASAMTWYRVALADGYMQPPLVASPWMRDEQLPEPLQWTWGADNGDLITRAGKGVFRLSFADNRNNWFHDVDCRLLSWPGGNTEAPMACDDGVERTMRIPGDGVVLVDDVQYVRVFDSDATTLPPEEVINVDELTAAAIKAAGISPKDVGLPESRPMETNETRSDETKQAAAPSGAATPEAPAAPAAADPVLPERAPIPAVRQGTVSLQNCGVC